MGWDTDQALLESLGARVTRLEGCCGLAGNFGMEAGHYDLSVAVAHRIRCCPRLMRSRTRCIWRTAVVPHPGSPARGPRGRPPGDAACREMRA